MGHSAFPPRAPSGVCASLVLALVLAVSACRSTTIKMDEAGAGASVSEAGKIPAEAFFGNPLFRMVRLSPSGEQMAAVVSQENVDVVMAIDLRSRKMTPLAFIDRDNSRVTDSREEASRRIRTIGWASEHVVGISVGMPRVAGRVRARSSRLIVSDVRDPRPRDLSEYWPRTDLIQFKDSVISWLPDDPDRILIQLDGIARYVDLQSGRLRGAEMQRHRIGGWRVDHRFQVRAGYSARRWNNDLEVWARISEDEDLERLVRWDPLDDEAVGPGFLFAGFSERPEMIYVLSERETGRDALYEYDLREGRLGRLVFSHPEYEVYGIRTSKLDGRLLSVHYVDDRPRIHFVDPKERRRWARVQRSFEGQNLAIVSSDRQERSSIFRISSDDSPPVYYRLDHRTGEVSMLFDSRPALAGQPLARMEPVRFVARDGLEIPGYLTRPIGAEGPTAAIVMPHGGPFSRDYIDWDPTVQFLVSRGFTVLQPNFRGSTGYGREFREAGYRQYGRAMQHDLEDGARWMVDQGLADPERLGIFGGSYGGYASLQALTSTPELFRAGASLAGMSDLALLIHERSAYSGNEPAYRALVGSPSFTGAGLEDISPIHHAERIQAPVLLAHGTMDSIVHVRHTERMAGRLERLGLEHEVHRYFGETHSFLDERTRIDFYQRLGAFFERHLRPDPELVARPVGPLADGAHAASGE